MNETTIASFVLRFTQEYAPEDRGRAAWRGVVRHVQSDQEIHFTRVADALAFISRYVQLGDDQMGDERVI